MEWVSMLAAANILLSKTDHPAVRQFLKRRLENGGAIPRAIQLQECCLCREKSQRVEEVKSLVFGKALAIMTDQMSDANRRFVLNILGAPLELSSDGKIKSFLLDTVFLEKTNHSTVGQAVRKCLMDFGISLNDVVVFKHRQCNLYEEGVPDHIAGNVPKQCAHHLPRRHNEHAWGDIQEAIHRSEHLCEKHNTYVKNMNAMFWHAVARKSRHLAHVGVRPKMPPNPTGTRWNCWYGAEYHLEYMEYFKAFIDLELQHSQSLGLNSLKELNEEELKVLTAMIKYIKDRSALFVETTNLFQSQSPMAIIRYGQP